MVIRITYKPRPDLGQEWAYCEGEFLGTIKHLSAVRPTHVTANYGHIYQDFASESNRSQTGPIRKAKRWMKSQRKREIEHGS